MKSRFVFLLAIMVLSAGCSKVDPQVLALLSKDDGDGGSDTPSKNGRITLGSDSAVTTGGGYQLKGRISTIQPATGAAVGGYKLSGTVRF